MRTTNVAFKSLVLFCLVIIYPIFPVTSLNIDTSGRSSSVDTSAITNIDSPILPYTSCTIFTVEHNNTIYFAGSEDEGGQRRNTRFWFVPTIDEAGYSAMYFGFIDNLPGGNDIDGLAIGGMNSEGLCFDANGVMPPAYVTPNNQLGTSRSGIEIWQYILRECATVKDVLHWYSSHNMGGWWGNQIHWADATGDAVVISAGRNNEVAFTRKEGDYIISTNFNLDNYSHGSYPCARYSTVENYLNYYKSHIGLSEVRIRDTLKSVHLVGTTNYIGTIYSYIFYPQTLDVVLYILRDYENPIRFNLEEELLKGEKEVRITPDLYLSYNSSYMTSNTSSTPIPGFDFLILFPLILIVFFSRRKRVSK